jgi:hypothetical protein
MHVRGEKSEGKRPLGKPRHRWDSDINANLKEMGLEDVEGSFLPLGTTAQGELWPPEQSASILLYSEADCLVFE